MSTVHRALREMSAETRAEAVASALRGDDALRAGGVVVARRPRDDGSVVRTRGRERGWGFR